MELAAASTLMSTCLTTCLYPLFSSVNPIGVQDGPGGRFSPTVRLPHHLPVPHSSLVLTLLVFRMVLAAASPLLSACLTTCLEEEEVEILVTDTTHQEISWLGRRRGQLAAVLWIRIQIGSFRSFEDPDPQAE